MVLGVGVGVEEDDTAAALMDIGIAIAIGSLVKVSIWYFFPEADQKQSPLVPVHVAPPRAPLMSSP